MQCATMATTFGVYFAHLTTLEEQEVVRVPSPLASWQLRNLTKKEEEQLPAALVSSIPSIMAFTMFLFCPISTALSKVSNYVIIS